jgi:hypothetical protein
VGTETRHGALFVEQKSYGAAPDGSTGRWELVAPCEPRPHSWANAVRLGEDAPLRCPPAVPTQADRLTAGVRDRRLCRGPETSCVGLGVPRASPLLVTVLTAVKFGPSYHGRLLQTDLTGQETIGSLRPAPPRSGSRTGSPHLHHVPESEI